MLFEKINWKKKNLQHANEPGTDGKQRTIDS